VSSSPSSAASASAEPPGGTTYPGQRLGLPATGRGATAGWPRRILALALDWLACLLVTRLVGASGAAEGWVTLLVFFVEVSLFTALVGGSFGQLLTRIAVVRLDGTPANLPLAVVRSFLICLVVPPLIYNRDQRGLHDLAIGTITVRR
jgi:uncharacterized RDD family membrane protein YckC